MNDCTERVKHIKTDNYDTVRISNKKGVVLYDSNKHSKSVLKSYYNIPTYFDFYSDDKTTVFIITDSE